MKKLKNTKKKQDNLMDPKKIGVPNICFSLERADDDRAEEFARQRIERGFDDSETWSLCDTIANFSIPRLEVYVQHHEHVIVDEHGHVEKVKKLIKAFKLITRDKGSRIWSSEEETTVEEGLKLFPEIFLALWW
jgi:hypothetical protein